MTDNQNHQDNQADNTSENGPDDPAFREFMEGIKLTMGGSFEDPYHSIPTASIYDAFADTATQLGGEYVHLTRNANSANEEIYWRSMQYALRDERDAVPPDDRDSLIEYMERWNEKINELRSQRS